MTYTIDQIFDAFERGNVGYMRAMRLTKHRSYLAFLKDYFATGRTYPEGSKEDFERSRNDLDFILNRKPTHKNDSEQS